MKFPSLFIIVPVYNALPYLKACLDSIKAQTYGDFWAILVDDGSTDESLACMREYASADSRFVCLSKNNQGVGEARNHAIEYVVNLLGYRGGGRELFAGL